jgi:hypothetical protein
MMKRKSRAVHVLRSLCFGGGELTVRPHVS